MKTKIQLMIVVMCVILTACAFKKETDDPQDIEPNIAIEQENEEVKSVRPVINVTHGEYVINVDDYCELAGFADYVVLGRVEKELPTEYRWPVESVDDDGNPKILTSPFACYEVQVLENLKGSLAMENTIIITKDGGKDKDSGEYVLFESDILPEEGSVYVFYIYVQEDGSNLVSGPNSNIPIELLEDPQISTYSSGIVEESQDIISEIRAGVNDEIIPEGRERTISNDDTNK